MGRKKLIETDIGMSNEEKSLLKEIKCTNNKKLELYKISDKTWILHNIKKNEIEKYIEKLNDLTAFNIEKKPSYNDKHYILQFDLFYYYREK